MWRYILFLFLFPGQLLAGPWLQSEHRGFLSFSTEVSMQENSNSFQSFSTLYAEYGLREDLTFGIDLGSDGIIASKHFIFVRQSLPFKSQSFKLSYELGLGSLGDRTAIRPGLSVGRGIQINNTSGWMVVDLRYATDSAGAAQTELDVGLGLKLWQNITSFVQIQSVYPDTGSEVIRLAPSLLIGKSENRRLKLGVITGLSGANDTLAEIAIWQQF